MQSRTHALSVLAVLLLTIPAGAQEAARRAVIWYDKKDSDIRDWRIDSSPASLDAFRAAISDPRILSANAAQATAIRHEPG